MRCDAMSSISIHKVQWVGRADSYLPQSMNRHDMKFMRMQGLKHKPGQAKYYATQTDAASVTDGGTPCVCVIRTALHLCALQRESG